MIYYSRDRATAVAAVLAQAAGAERRHGCPSVGEIKNQ